MVRSPLRDARLLELRARLAEIDRAIVRELTRRERWQQALLAYKQRRGIPVFDRGQERIALERAATWAGRSGLDPALARGVIRLSIDSGKRRFVAGRRALRPRVRRRPRSSARALRRRSPRTPRPRAAR